jgi:hypothetical protein
MTRTSMRIAGPAAAMLAVAVATISPSVASWVPEELWGTETEAEKDGALLSPSARAAVELLAAGARESDVAAILAESDGSLGASREAAAARDPLAASGPWRSGRFDAAERSWQVQLERDRRDGTISGTIAVAGSALLGAAARVDGRIDGEKVSGVITDDSGRQVASFSGTAGEDGMAGTFTTVDGDSGEWRHGGMGW